MKSQKQKYDEAVSRNFSSFKAGLSTYSVERLAILAKHTLQSLKTKVGIKAADSIYDVQLDDMLKQAQSKVEAQTKKEKPPGKIQTPVEANTDAKPAQVQPQKSGAAPVAKDKRPAIFSLAKKSKKPKSV